WQAVGDDDELVRSRHVPHSSVAVARLAGQPRRCRACSRPRVGLLWPGARWLQGSCAGVGRGRCGSRPGAPRWRKLPDMAGERGEQQPPTREVGGYRLLHSLGSGGMGTVYEAVDAEDRHVALKLLHPAFSADEAARERLRREVATLHRVKGESVARVLDAEAESAEAFIVTEL